MHTLRPSGIGRFRDRYLRTVQNIGIEFDGLKWHSEKYGKDKRYHLKKTLEANRRGVKLIHVFEDEWLIHKQLVLSKIMHAVGLDDGRVKIGARKCTVAEITKNEAKSFLDRWHIQGFVSSTLYYGAYYNETLVGVMTYKHYGDKNEWEMTRFAVNGEYSVPGLGGKMFAQFRTDKHPELVKSFADRRWTMDCKNNLYTRIGFVLEGISRPDYRYVVRNERKHKFGFRKQILHRKHGLPLSMTEKEMCDSLGFYRIWDCGLFKYVWRINNNKIYKKEETDKTYNYL